LSGRVVAITGAGRGIGAATAAELARRGAQVVVGDIDVDLAHETAERIGRGAVPLEVDVTDPTSLTGFLDEAERHGPLGVLVNNAGIMPISRMIDEDDAATARMLAVNLGGVIAGSRDAARRVVAHGGGHIVNVASTAGKAGLVGLSTYCGTKAAVIAFSEAIEQELAPHGVQVSVVLPGIVRTELAAGVPELRGVPSITPDQVAAAVADTLVAPRFEVYVPRVMGPLLSWTRLLPHRAGLRLARAMGAQDIFLDATAHPDRAAYEARVAGRPVQTTRGVSSAE
jgi:NAD(P)-dependent dehydrogenase (short-subunit alcohol dehydrogenase family)